jgi:hypothetical protein
MCEYPQQPPPELQGTVPALTNETAVTDVTGSNLNPNLSLDDLANAVEDTSEVRPDITAPPSRQPDDTPRMEPVDVPSDPQPAPESKEDRTGYEPWQPYMGTLQERVGDKLTPSKVVPLGSLALSDEVNGVPYEDLPYTTAEELIEISATKEAELQEAREASGEQPKPPKTSSVEGMISRTEGPFLEIGGPSQAAGGRTSIDFEAVDKPLIVSNVYPQYVRVGYWRNPIGGEVFNTERPGLAYRIIGEESLQDPITWESVRRMPDAKIDGENLPEGEGYLGAIYARAVVPEVELPLITNEAPRCLETGGIFVMDRIKAEAITALRESPYFDILKLKRHGIDPTARWTSAVARRNDVPYVIGRANDRDRR